MSINLMDDVSFGFADTINADSSLLDLNVDPDFLAQLRQRTTPAHPTKPKLADIFEQRTPNKPQPAAPPTPLAHSTPPLIDLSTPRPTPPGVLLQRPTPLRAPPPPSWLSSLPRRPSPLKQAHETALVSPPGSDAGPSPPQTVRKGVRDARSSDEADKENGPGVLAESPSRKVFAGGKKWAVVQDERRRARGSSRSPVKELLAQVGDQSHIGDESTFSAFGAFNASDESLLMDQQLSGVADATFDSPAGPSAGPAPALALPAVGEEDEPQTDDSRSDVFHSLDRSRMDATALTSDGGSILPTSLTSSTRHARSKSLGSALTAGALATVDGVDRPAGTPARRPSGVANLLGMSTASYKDHRDSPARPRMVSIQAERFGGAAIASEVAFPSPVLPTNASSPVREPASPLPPDFLQLDAHAPGSDSVNLSAVHELPDLSSLDLLAVAAPSGMDSIYWGDESMMVPTPLRQARAGKLVDVPSPESVAPGQVLRGQTGVMATPARTGRLTVATPRGASGSVVATPKATSGAERLRLKTTETKHTEAATTGVGPASAPNRARPLATGALPGGATRAPQPPRTSTHTAAAAARTPVKATLRSRSSIAAPGLVHRPSLAATAAPASAAKPRPSLMPTSRSTGRLSTLAGPSTAAAGSVPATPGRSESTRERLERAREERARRELQRSPEKRAGGAAAVGLGGSSVPVGLARPRAAAGGLGGGLERKPSASALTRGLYKAGAPALRTAVAAPATSGLTRASSLSRLPSTTGAGASGRPALARASSTIGASALSASVNGLRPTATRPAVAVAGRLASPTKPRPSMSTGLPAPRARPSVGPGGPAAAGKAGLGTTGVRISEAFGARPAGRG